MRWFFVHCFFKKLFCNSPFVVQIFNRYMPFVQVF